MKFRHVGVILALVCVMASGCGSEQTVDAVTSATPKAQNIVLGSTHQGYGKADCFACHENPHRNGLYSPGACVTCHGNNGAVQRPNGHKASGCTACHAAAHSPSELADNDCIACHKYAPGDQCQATETVDAVVIGSGGGGLAAAATLARAGKKVALLEKHNKVGGYMTRFQRGDYHFEISLHAMGSLSEEMGGPDMFRKLGIWDQLKPIKLEPMYKIVNPDFQMVVPSDPDTFKEMLKTQFPSDAANIDALFVTLRDAQTKFEELSAAQIAGGEVWDAYFDAHMADVLELFGYMNTTLSEFLDDYFTDPQLRTVITQLASYAGTEPDEISAGFFWVMWFGYHFDGLYYFEGGSERITQALAKVIEDNGGEVRLNTLVTGIDVTDGAVTGVRTENDLCYTTSYVVSNANGPDTFLKLVGEEHLETSFVESLNEMSVGLTGFVLYIGADADFTQYFDGAHEIFVNTSYDQHANFEYGLSCTQDLAPLLVTNYSLSDPTAAPKGKNVIVVATELGYDCRNAWHYYEDRAQYKQYSQEMADAILYRVEQLVPGLRDHIEVMSIATPPTLENFTLNPKGSFFGFHNTPEQALLNRLPQKTPITGLYLAGAWTFPGPGQSAVLQSGQIAASYVLKAMEGGEPQEK